MVGVHDQADESVPAEPVFVEGPMGATDPASTFVGGDGTASPPPLGPDEYYLVLPGEPLEVSTGLPRHRHGACALLARPEVLVFEGPRHRTTMRTPRAGGPPGGDVARSVVLAFVRHRPVGHVNSPKRFLLALDGHGGLLAELDFSDSWEPDVNALEAVCGATGLEFEIQRYQYEPELLAAHPGWVGGADELAIDHPVEEGVREWGMALFYGVLAALLLSSAGMSLAFGTPVGTVLGIVALAGGVVAAGLTVWSRSRRRRDRSAARAGTGTG